MQGFFLQRPVVVAGRSLPLTLEASARILSALQRRPLDLFEVEEVMKSDVALVDRLLRLLNNAALGLRQRITSLRHGLVLLGATQVRRWVSLLVLAELSSGRPPELATASLLRAHMCESLGVAAGLCGSGEHARSALDFYLTGMYSLLDVLLEQPMAQALSLVPLAPASRGALLGAPNPLRDVLEVVTAYEAGDWDRVETDADALGLREDDLTHAHQRALAATDAAAD